MSIIPSGVSIGILDVIVSISKASLYANAEITLATSSSFIYVLYSPLYSLHIIFTNSLKLALKIASEISDHITG